MCFKWISLVMVKGETTEFNLNDSFHTCKLSDISFLSYNCTLYCEPCEPELIH